MAEKISQEEADRTQFSIFAETLEALSHDAETACHEMGNYNTPWEIRWDLTSLAYLASSTFIGMNEEQREKTIELASLLEHLPDEAIAPKGMKMTSHAACLVGMNHPAWMPPRRAAAHLFRILEPTIARNQAYFYPTKP